jgi:CDP-2,3-bis-(O-geranylgeranyl)-sn-glycerol synthase
MNDYLAALLFFLPAGIANMSPVIINKVPYLNRWNTPLDFGKSFHGQRIFGDNKRLRGVVLGTLIGGLTGLLVGSLNHNTVGTISPFWAGCILGAGALLGDAVESFAKRQRGVKPGQPWFPFDQIDYIIGGLLAIYIFMQPQLWVMLTIFIVYFGLHLLLAYIGFLLGFKKTPI